MIVIDYLQLMRSGFDIKNREQEIAEISRGLKSLAKELNVPIIALSQLSRLVESRTDKKPLLSDLRESGQIEQDADMVIFTYRPQYYGIEQYEVGNQTIQTDSLMMLIVSKHRNGELGEMPMMFLGQFTKVIGHSMFEKNNVTFVPQQEPLKPNVDFLNTNYEEAEDPF
jgi:replicative DNA helicase